MEQSHEHTWRVTATFRAGRLAEPAGWVVDFLQVQAAMNDIARQLAGVDLNDLPAFGGEGASAERVAKFLAEALGRRMKADADKLYRLAVTEAPGCLAAYYP